MNKVVMQKDEIKFLLKFYFKQSWTRSGNHWLESNSDEIDNVVERIDSLIKLRVRELLGNDKRTRKQINKL